MTILWGPLASRHLLDSDFIDPYVTKVLGIQSGNLIGYWPMDESGGAVANDQSPENNDGAYTGVALANAASPTGVGFSPLWDGSNDYNNIYSAGFAADWSGNQHTISCWIKVSASGVWTDSTQRMILTLYSGATVISQIRKSTADDVVYFSSNAGGTNSQANYDYGTGPTTWSHVALTRSESGDAVKFYVDGSQVSTTKTGLGVWSGALSSTQTLIGAWNTTPTQVWDGWMAHPAIWKVALGDSDISTLATV